MSAISQALPRIQLATAVEQLGQLVAIPSVSNPNSPDYNMTHLENAADFVASKLQKLGFNVRFERIDGSAPFVLAEKVVSAAKKTILLYAHYDVQPVDREKWIGDPFVMTERDGRLYGRGASDDKGGIIAILAALEAYQNAKMELPVNVKILFEGEEEYGSTHMNALLKQEGERLKADALVVMDGGNRDVHSGTLTSSTRGLANIHLQVNALQKPVHSGVGCLVPDPALALARLVGSLSDPKSIPGFLDDFESLKPAERELLSQSSQTAASYAQEMGVTGGDLRGDPNVSIYERIVEEPSISLVNMNAGQPNGGNSIQDSASCTIGIRVAPGQDPDRVADVVMKYLKSQPVLYNLPIEMNLVKKGSWAWKADLSKPFSNLYLKALAENFKNVCAMPCGGALPLLREFQGHFPTMEMVVPAVEDPASAAHSHNESQDLNLLENAANSLIAFLYKAGQISSKCCCKKTL